MKKLIIKLFLLCALVILPILGYSKLADVATAKYDGINTADQIRESFKNAVGKDHNCYFLGNSRIYRDIDPDCFTHVSAYNFGHDNDSYNQMYYKLLYLLDHGENVEHLVIGTDYFQFSFLSDTRNYVYNNLFPAEYRADYGDLSEIEIKKDYFVRLWSNKQNALLACLRYVLGRPKPEHVKMLKENGQYLVYGQADPEEIVDRDYTVMDIQYRYFRKIIACCEEHDIDLYVIMPPLSEGEIKTHTDEERQVFDTMILRELEGTPYRGHYHNYRNEKGLLPYTEFIDATHLKPDAAQRYSTFLNAEIFE
ncbi:MAG: hypothetical protein K6E16_06110 [Lachnospiraceae bacterium]|nr:hypothetical protein [Lachnospiraceae bacterium]